MHNMYIVLCLLYSTITLIKSIMVVMWHTVQYFVQAKETFTNQDEMYSLPSTA